MYHFLRGIQRKIIITITRKFKIVIQYMLAKFIKHTPTWDFIIRIVFFWFLLVLKLFYYHLQVFCARITNFSSFLYNNTRTYFSFHSQLLLHIKITNKFMLYIYFLIISLKMFSRKRQMFTYKRKRQSNRYYRENL